MTAEDDSDPGAILFTPGPVMLDAEVRGVGGRPMVYHRTDAFSRRIENCERLLKAACGARPEDRVIMLTASGTGAMEAAVTNLFAPGEKVLVVNSGDFGRRFLEICEGHGCRAIEIALAPGRQIRSSQLEAVDASGCAELLVNHHETSTGGLLDLGLISRFCREHGLLLVVDAIGSFLADPLSVAAAGIDALIVSSQKALALPPGMSFVVLSARAAERARQPRRRSYYFDFRKYLDDIVRGQTPFTPAVGLILQLERRLEQVAAAGPAAVIGGVARLALDFRRRIGGLPSARFPRMPGQRGHRPGADRRNAASALRSPARRSLRDVRLPHWRFARRTHLPGRPQWLRHDRGQCPARGGIARDRRGEGICAVGEFPDRRGSNRLGREGQLIYNSLLVNI